MSPLSIVTIIAGGMVLILLMIIFYMLLDWGLLSFLIAIPVGGGVGAGAFFIKKSMDG